MLFGANDLRSEIISSIKGSDIAEFMIIYGLGASAVFFVIMFMYRVALSNAKELELTDIEIFDTKASIRSNLLMALIPLVSVFFALIFKGNPMLAGITAGFSYFLYSPVMFINGNRMQKARARAIENHLPSEPSAVASNAGEPI
jgi:hypothetical protein